MKKRISEIEQSNEIASIALSRTRIAIRRLRLENSVLLERLELRLLDLPEFPESKEDMSRPTSPVLTDDILNLKAARNGSMKTKKPKVTLSTSSATKKIARDPYLPKKPVNAYWVFFEMEKEKLKTQLEAKGTEIPAADIPKTLSDIWKGMSDEEKKPFQKLFEDDRDRYQKDMSVYSQITETSKSSDPNGEDLSAEEENTNALDELPRSEGNKRQKLSSSIDDSQETKIEAGLEANNL